MPWAQLPALQTISKPNQTEPYVDGLPVSSIPLPLKDLIQKAAVPLISDVSLISSKCSWCPSLPTCLLYHRTIRSLWREGSRFPLPELQRAGEIRAQWVKTLVAIPGTHMVMRTKSHRLSINLHTHAVAHMQHMLHTHVHHINECFLNIKGAKPGVIANDLLSVLGEYKAENRSLGPTWATWNTVG